MEELRETGPRLVRYDQSPELLDTDSLATLLEQQILPIIERRDLPLGTFALFWVLVTPQGDVGEVVLQTSSGIEEFDERARVVARSLHYKPAKRGGRVTPVWILSRIHLRMP